MVLGPVLGQEFESLAAALCGFSACLCLFMSS